MSRAEKWERVPIAELIEKGRSATSQDDDSVVWNLNLDQIEPDTGRVLQKVMTPKSELGSSTYPFEANTVLYSKLRPYLNKVVVPDEDGWATTELVPLKCKPKVWPYFLAYLLRGRDFLSFANATVAGAKMPRMVMEKFWEYEVSLPPLPEQKRIAAILDSADAIRQKRKAAIAKLDQLAQSVFLEMFGDPVKNEKGWSKATLGEVTENIQVGVVIQPASHYADDGAVALRGLNIKPGYIDLSEIVHFRHTSHIGPLAKSRLRTDDVVIVRTGAPGVSATVPKELNDANCIDLLIVRPNHEVLRPHYIVGLMNSVTGKKMADEGKVGIAQQHLNVGALREMVVPVPTLSQQQKYEEALSGIQSFARNHQKALETEETLFSSLQHRAFAGEL